MNDVAMLHGAEPREILETVIERKVPAIMSYLSKGKWHVAKVQVSNLGANKVDVQIISGSKPQPINIQVDQPVGMSIKFGYGKVIFETKVVALEPPADEASGGTIVLEAPGRIEIVQRRNYFRVDVPQSLKVNVLLWHRKQRDQDSEMPTDNYWQGQLIDISAGGAQIALDAGEKPDFKNGQFVGMRFTPAPYETPLLLTGQIRNILPTADGSSVCLGLQAVGLEASPEGRQVLQRLCGVVEHYYEINQSNGNGDKQRLQSSRSAV